MTAPVVRIETAQHAVGWAVTMAKSQRIVLYVAAVKRDCLSCILKC